MNISQIETFIWVAELNSFTAAAKRLYMSQPAISFQIKSLEEELQISLFQRYDKKIILTEAGKLFYNEAKEIIEHYYKITDGINNIKGLKVGELNLGASTIPGEYILPHFIGNFKKLYTEIEIKLRIGGSGDVIDWVKNKEVALGITGTKVKESGIECESWLQDELTLIAPAIDKYKNKKEISVKELTAYPLIMRDRNSGTRKTLEEKLKLEKYSLNDFNIVMELGSSRSVITAVQAGLGLSFVSSWAVQESLSLGKIITIDIPDLYLARKLYLARNPLALGGSFAASAFMNYLKDNQTLEYLGFGV